MSSWSKEGVALLSAHRWGVHSASSGLSCGLRRGTRDVSDPVPHVRRSLCSFLSVRSLDLVVRSINQAYTAPCDGRFLGMVHDQSLRKVLSEPVPLPFRAENGRGAQTRRHPILKFGLRSIGVFCNDTPLDVKPAWACE
jgi:hypothetical protein